MEVEVAGKSLKIKVNNQAELAMAIQTAREFIAPD